MSKKGYKQTEEHKMKVKLSRTSEQRRQDAIKAGNGKWMKGRTAWNKGLKGFRAGEKRPGSIPKGELNGNYIKDRSLLVKNERKDLDYAYMDWSKRVKDRDKWKCRIANEDCKGRLESHHILGWKSHPELRYQLNNGITLCQAHHPLKRDEVAKLSPFFQQMVAEMN